VSPSPRFRDEPDIFLFNTTLARIVQLHRKLFNALGWVGKQIIKLPSSFEKNQDEAYFDNKKLAPPLAMLPEIPFLDQKVLGENTGAEKWIAKVLPHYKF